MRFIRGKIGMALALGLSVPVLAGCNSPSANTQASVPPASAYRIPGVTPPGFRLPSGGDCAAEIARFEAILQNDLNSGNVGQQVFNRIQTELAPARSACAAGRDAEGRAALAASRRRHGYPI